MPNGTGVIFFIGKTLLLTYKIFCDIRLEIRGIMMKGNMTQGNVSKNIIRFAIPMILGNIFQLTYNAVDSIIVGRYAGEEALASIGTANPIMNIVMFFIIGICLGASILMSEFFGAGDFSRLKREVSTTIIAGGIFTIMVAMIGFMLTPLLLRMIQTPDEIIHMSSSYLRIIFVGLIFTFLYNIYAASLRSIGDSKTPIYFLIASAILNGCLDMIFVGVMNLGVTGAAFATIIAESLSCILCIRYVYRKIPLLQLKLNEFVFDRALIKKTVSYSWATAMQQTILQIGKVLVQGAVNPLGVDSIAAFNAVNRADDFAFMPQQSIASAMTVFIAQNRGAAKNERIKEGFRRSLIIEIVYCIILMIVMLIFARNFMGLFVTNSSSQIVILGTTYLRYMAFFYIIPGFTNWLQGYFRGMGEMKITFYSTTVQIIFRVIFVYAFIPIAGFTGIAYACLGGWIAMLLYEVPAYYRYTRKKQSKNKA
nr:MATE family efflux transporter [Lachnotalea glycerini]